MMMVGFVVTKMEGLGNNVVTIPQCLASQKSYLATSR